ncbi:HNH endonuclease signature motif containing protein [Nocardia vinacea]|uniref:HNH endonuclease n=1 Tax=Nocardia vinacea TaxID=96468 RepID=UPI0033EBC6C3
MAWSGSGRSAEFVRNRPLVLQRDRYTCQLRLDGCVGAAAEVDHRRAVKFGGSDALDNLQAVCGPCHKQKTQDEARYGLGRRRAAAVHPDHRRKHPGFL